MNKTFGPLAHLTSLSLTSSVFDLILVHVGEVVLRSVSQKDVAKA